MFDDDIPPNESVLPAFANAREELSHALEGQNGRIGQIHTLLQNGKTPSEIGEEFGISPSSAPSYIAEYRNAINAILDGQIPSPSQIIPATRKFNSFTSKIRGNLGENATDLLDRNYRLLIAARNRLAPATSAQAERVAEKAEEAETNSLHTPGIYAFTYGHYLDYPIDPNTGNTLIKVGKADDVAARIAQHRSGVRTHIPEPLVTLRVYEVKPDAKLDEIDKQFHQLLTTAGHQNPHASSNYGRSEVGREWFLTNTDFLDQIAAVLNLSTSFSN